MNRTTSIYLDFVRFLSAVLVFFCHAKYSRFDGAWLKEVGAYGHDAVIVFFVLSGFVIACISSTRESTARCYCISRLARLYSVVMPALLLTLVLDFFGQHIDASMYAGEHYQASEPGKRLFANIFFVNEIWFTSFRAFSNGPFWSLSYEFWYYAIYAAYYYFSGWSKWLLTGVAIVIAGPKILILFPVWMIGVVTFHLSKKIHMSELTGLCLAIAPIVVYFKFRYIGMPEFLLNDTAEILGRDFVYEDIKLSSRFLNDYIVGGLLAIHLLGVISIAGRFSLPSAIEKPIRYLAGMTFALYLFHYPFLQFYGSIVNDGVIVVILTFLSVLVLAPYTEGKKKEWYSFIESALSGLNNRLKIALLITRR